MNAPEQIDRVGATSAPFNASNDARLQVSALVDGELDDTTIERAIDALLASDELADFWADAHRAGDWMRSDEVIGVGDGQMFLREFSARLAAEPTVIAPGGAKRSRTKLRTQRFWIRTGLPGASIAAALLVVAWVATPLGRGDGDTSVAGGKPTLVIAADNAERPLRPMDPERLSDYLAAHRDVTPFAYRGASARPASYSTPAGQTEPPPPR